MQLKQVWLMVCAAVIFGSPILAEPVSLFNPVLFPNAKTALVSLKVETAALGNRGSLFTEGTRPGFFTPLPPREKAQKNTGSTPRSRLRDLIARAEAGPLGYDAVQYGAVIKPPKPPTQMTISEIQRWVSDTPGQPHAIGRYQFIPTTLKYLVGKTQVPVNTRFSTQVQDLLADQLLDQAGLPDLMAGRLERSTFQNKLAKIWAGLPTSDGRSHYQGYAGNKATISRAMFDREMGRIFPG